MKKTGLRGLLIAAGCVAVLTARAQGIPTIDVASIAQLAQQYQVMQDQFNKLNEMKNMATGARGMGNLFNDPSIRAMLPRDWQQVIATVKNTPAFAAERARFPTNAANPKANALYDNIAAQNATTSTFFTQANDRLAQVQRLMGQIDLATDPAAKADLQARLINEQNAIQSTTQLLAVIERKQQQDINAASMAAQQEFVCKEFKSSGC